MKIGHRRAIAACMVLGGFAGACLGWTQGWIGAQLALVALCVLVLKEEAALPWLQAGFAFGVQTGACASFVLGVEQDMRVLAVLPVLGLVLAAAALAWVGGRVALRLGRTAVTRLLLAIPATWIAQEWLLGQGELAFPWARLGYAQASGGPAAGLLPIGGTLLASGAMLVAAGAIALTWRMRSGRRAAGAALAAIAALSLLSHAVAWTHPTTDLQADLAQSGLTSAQKTQPVNASRLLAFYLEAARRGRGALLVTPQLAFPKVPAALPPGYLDAVGAALARRDGDAMLGMHFDDSARAGYYNGILTVGTSTRQRYLKSQLFPFGEFIPLRGAALEWLQRQLPAPQMDSLRPDVRGDTLSVAGHRIAPAICYEAAFPQAWREAAATADVLVNASSDSSVQTDQLARQFLQVDQARAIEFGRPVLRTSDIRGTYAIDSDGRVLDGLPPLQAGVLAVSVTGRSGLTPYARFGDTLPLCIATMGLLAALLLSRQPATTGPTTTRTRRLAPQRGQVLPLSIVFVLIIAALFYFMVNAGQSVTEKVRVTNAADAAAYSAGIIEARALNYDAYLNRAMVANEMVIAQMVSYGSWVEYLATASDNYHASASDVNFFTLPDPRVAVLDVVFGGSEFLSHYYGETVQEYADYVVDYGIGPIITVNDAVVMALSAAQELVRAEVSVELRQGHVAQDVATAMDPALKAEIVLPTLDMPLFITDWSGDDRTRFADVAVRSRDAFTRQRNWTITGATIPGVRKDGALKKRAGTELIGLDEWRGVDTLEIHGRHWVVGPGCGRFQIGWCSDIAEPVGWGGLEIDAGGGDAGHGYHGNAYGENAAAAHKSDENMKSPQYYNFSGMPSSVEISDVDPKADDTTGVTIMITKQQSATLTSGNSSTTIQPTGDLALFGDHPAKGKVIGLSRATVYFDRIERRADGKQELGSLYNPYWRVHLTAPSEVDLAYAAAQQGGLTLPVTPP